MNASAIEIDWSRLDAELRRADFKVALAQHIEAQCLLDALHATSVEDANPSQPARYLGPLYCASPAQQERFPKLLAAALGPAVPPRPRADKKFDALRITRYALSAIMLIAMLLGSFGAVPGSYYRIEAGDARSTLNEFSEKSGIQVLFDFTALTGVKTKSVEGSFSPREALMRMLRGTRVQFDDVNDRTVALSLADSAEAYVPSRRFPFEWLLFLLACCLTYWLVSRFRGATPPPSSVRALSRAERRSLELRFKWGEAGRELRRRQWVDFGELNVEATLNTFCSASPPRMIFGRRVEPEYIVLIHEMWRSDHLARMADEMLLALGAVDVSITRFYFWDSPLVCEGPAPERRARPPFLPTISLEELVGKYRDARFVVVSDAACFFDSQTGQRRPWVLTLLEAGPVHILTPLQREDWGPKERALSELGFGVLPLTPAGVTEMGQVFGNQELAAPLRAIGARSQVSMCDPVHLLMSTPPDNLRAEQVCEALRMQVGEDGLLLLQAVALSREIRWSMTVRIGLALMRGTQLAASLPRLVGLPWFRHAYMPNWLRTSLVSTLTRSQRSQVRTTLSTIAAAHRQ
jgi:hypothetical protein